MRFLNLAAAWFLVLTLCACGSNSSGQASNAGDQANDALLVTAVATKLATVDVDAATSVHVSAKDGAITLSGQAHSPDERARYVDAARGVSGVKAVNDRLIINGSLHGVRASVNDAQLTTRVSAAIAANAGVNVFHVATSVHDGVVTLRGSVPTPALKATVLSAARSVSGVRGVIDFIAVRR